MKRFVYKYVLSYIGFIVVKLINLTYRIKVINQRIEDEIYNRGELPIYISLHQRFFPGIAFLAKRNKIAIIISQSSDGDLISKIVEIFGWCSIRGSSSKGGARALVALKKLIKEGYAVGHVVDGPRGPFGKIKPGLLTLARISKMPILPIISSAEKKWVFNSWDRFMIPKPFSKIIMRFDKEIYIPENSSQEKFNDTLIKIEDRLMELYRETDDIWGK